MEGTGYIYSWQIGADRGRIRVCSGGFQGLNVDYLWVDCDDALKARLAQANITLERACPPPAGALQVTFGFDIEDGTLVACPVSEVRGNGP